MSEEEARSKLGLGPSEAVPPSTPTRFSPALIGTVVALLVILGVGGIAWSLLGHERERLLERRGHLLEGSARVAASTVSRTLSAFDLVISLIADDYTAGRLTLDEVIELIIDRLHEGANQLPDLETFAFLDTDGTVRFSTNRDAVGHNLAGRAYFKAHAEATVEGMYIDQPLNSVVPPHRRIIPLSWALRDGDGAFVGVIVAVTTARFFTDLVTPLLNEEGEALAIVDQDLTLFATDGRGPAIQSTDGGKLLALQGLPKLERSRPWYQAFQDSEGTNYLRAVARARGTGLFVVATTPIKGLLASWRLLAELVLAGIVLAGTLLGVLAAYLHRAHLDLRRATVRALNDKARAEAGERAKARFLATMSHEIRTPMTAMLGMVDLVADEPLQPKVRGYLTAVRRSGEQLLAIINDILDFMKLGADTLSLSSIDFDLRAHVEEVHSVIRPQIVQQGLDFDLVWNGPEPLPLKGDPRRLKQVLYNLLNNATKFTRKGGILLRVESRPHVEGQALVRIDVEDTGVGIDPIEAEQLFNPFVQAKRTMKDAIGGTGLGLTISKSLVEAMGGRIGCDSRPEGGSRFWVEIPFEAGCARAIKEEAKVEIPHGRPLSILLAEDAPLNQELIIELLTRQRHKTTLAGNGVEFLDLAAKRAYDLLILDISMPIMDGETAVRHLRERPGPNRYTPTVALTANVIETDQKRYLSAGFNACLSKPIERGIFFGTINRLTSGAQLLPEPAADGLGTDLKSAAAIDWTFLDRMQQGVAAGRVSAWMRRAVEEAEETLSGLRDLADPVESGRRGHRLKGTSRNFGLQAIGDAAEKIERAAYTGTAPLPLGELEEAIARTRQTLQAEGLI